MGIYNTEGELDLVEAAAEVKGASGRANRAVAEQSLARIQAAALLDIAGSLRALALESSFRLRDQLNELGAYDEPGDELPDVRPEDAPAGSRVRHVATNDEGVLNEKRGEDQGAKWNLVEWDDGDVSKVWAGTLEVISLPGAIVELPDGTILGDGVTPPTLTDIRESEVPLVGVATEGEAPALRAEDDGEGETEEAVGGYELDAPANTVADPDDLDDDFDGDDHPAAVDALAALKAREKAARAAKPKKGKK